MSTNRGGSLDANILLRLLVGDVPVQQQHALKLLESGHDYVVSDTALIETIYALYEYYHVPRHTITRVLQPLFDHVRISFDSELFRETLRLYAKHPSLSIEDCYMAVRAKHTGNVPLWTFDKKLARQVSNLARELG